MHRGCQIAADYPALSGENLRPLGSVITLNSDRSSPFARFVSSSPFLFCHRRPGMRFFAAICSLTIVAICCVTPVRAQDASWQLRTAARRELELAKIDLRNYWQIEYPRQRR